MINKNNNDTNGTNDTNDTNDKGLILMITNGTIDINNK